MHAFPESDMMRAAFLQMQVYRHAYWIHLESSVPHASHGSPC